MRIRGEKRALVAMVASALVQGTQRTLLGVGADLVLGDDVPNDDAKWMTEEAGRLRKGDPFDSFGAGRTGLH